MDAEKFSAISAEAQKQVRFIEGSIENLRLSLQLTNDPQEIQQILDAIKILTAARFDTLIQELNAIKDSLSPEQFQQALTGLQLGRQVALRELDAEKLGVTLGQIDINTDRIGNRIDTLSNQITNSTDVGEIETLLGELGDAIREKYRVQREVLQKQLDNELITIDAYNTQLGRISLQEVSELAGAEDLVSREVSDLLTTRGNLVTNAIEREQLFLDNVEFNVREAEERFNNLRTLTNTFYDTEAERIDALQASEEKLQNLREDNFAARLQALQEIDNLEEQYAQDQLAREREIANARLQAARSREDLSIQLERGLIDLGIDLDPYREEFERLFSGQIRLSDDVLEGNRVIDLLGLGDDRVGSVFDLFRNYSRGLEDLDLQESRAAEDRTRDAQEIGNTVGNVVGESLQTTLTPLLSNSLAPLFEPFFSLFGLDVPNIAPEIADAAETSTPTTDATQSLTEIVVESPILETPAIQEAMLQATEAVLTVENLEIAALDAELSLFNETAFAHMRAAEKHSAAADKYSAVAEKNSAVADALLNAVNQLASSGGRGGGRDYRFLLQFPNGAVREVNHSLLEGEATGELLGFGGD